MNLPRRKPPEPVMMRQGSHPAAPAPAPARASLLQRVLGSKAAVQIPGQDVGFDSWWGSAISAVPGRKAMPRNLQEFYAVYGGTEESVVWVTACADVIASEVAAYPWLVTDEAGDTIEADDLPPELRDLIEQPNDRSTYFDFMEMVMLDLELVGNSYWLKDNVNAVKQPAALMRLRPEYVRIAADDFGMIAGYAYEHPAMTIGYEPDEIIHFRYQAPGDDYYGMGTVEKIQREIGLDILQSEHVVGFFREGAKLSGLLTIEGTYSQQQFDRIRRQFEQFKHGDSSEFGILLAEQGVSFSPVSTGVAGSGVIEMKSMTKDAILTGFGVPAFLLGGVAQGGIYKMSEAQHIFTRRQMPKVVRVKERMTMDLLQLWGELAFEVDQAPIEDTDTLTDRAARSVGNGLSLNEIREIQGMPPIDDEAADEPLLAGGILPWSQVVAPPEPPPPFGLPPGQPEEPAADETATPELPPGSQEEEDQVLEGEIVEQPKAVMPPFRREVRWRDIGDSEVAAGLGEFADNPHLPARRPGGR